MDVAEEKVKVAEKRRQDALDALLESETHLKTERRFLEFAQKRADEQFWCLERELEASGEPNLYAQVREATDLEKEIFGLDSSFPVAQVEAEASSSQGS